MNSGLVKKNIFRKSAKDYRQFADNLNRNDLEYYLKNYYSL